MGAATEAWGVRGVAAVTSTQDGGTSVNAGADAGAGSATTITEAFAPVHGACSGGATAKSEYNHNASRKSTTKRRGGNADSRRVRSNTPTPSPASTAARATHAPQHEPHVHRSRRYSTRRKGVVAEGGSRKSADHPKRQTRLDADHNAKARAGLLGRLAGGHQEGGPSAGRAQGFHIGPERKRDGKEVLVRTNIIVSPVRKVSGSPVHTKFPRPGHP